MQKTKKSFATIAIAILLMISMSASIMFIPSANAHTPAWKIPTYAYIWASPNPVGVDQTVSVYMWLTNIYYGAALGNDIRFQNYELTITSPTGTVSTQTFPTVYDTTSNQHTDFVPDQVGTYNLTFTFPGQVYTQTTPISASLFSAPGPNPYTNDTFLPSSASTTVTVQQMPIANALSGAPLPTSYWTRPIYGENTNWYSIASNWLGLDAPGYGGWAGAQSALGPIVSGGAMFPGDAVGSQTSHVMWTKPLQSGGVVGGTDVPTGDTYFDGSAYLIRYNNPIIMDGMLYYTEPIGFANSGFALAGAPSGYGPTVCINLQTGQQIWSSNNVPVLSFGYIQSVDTPNEHGVTPPILISISTDFTGATTWMCYDGDTGNWICNVTNVPSPAGDPSRVMGPDGNYLAYVLANSGSATKPDWTLAEWNSSLLFAWDVLPFPAGPQGIINGGSGSDYDWNISIPWLNSENPNSMTSPPNIIAGNYNDGLLCEYGTYPSNGENTLFSTISSTPYTYFFINLNASNGAIGQVLWSNTLNPPADNLTVVPPGTPDWKTGVFVECYKETMQWVGYSLDTGKKIWGPLASQQALDYYGSPSSGNLAGQLAYGRLYSSAYGGTLYCYSDSTGQLLWTYGNGGTGNSTNAGFNYPYGDYPTFINAIGNGIVYLITTAHTWTTPIYKGALARAVNATTGKEIWTISSITAEFTATSYAMADGYNTWFNGYDSSIYVVGRGPSETSVTASPSVATYGDNVVISGTVMDISAGTTQNEQAADFPHGVPVSSDASMAAWMGYVYQQQPEPNNFTGIPVTLSILDSNGNYRTIGTVVTDENGAFHLTWKPDITGNFTVYASFAGTNGYYGSNAEAFFNIMNAQPTTAPTATPLSGVATQNTLEYIGIAIIIVIVIIGVVLAILVTRKRP